MNKIIEQIVEIDKQARSIIAEAEDKQENLEAYIEEEIKLKESKIEVEVKKVLYEKQKDYDYELKKESQKIKTKLTRNLKKINENYENNKEQMIEDSFNKIIG